MIAEYAAPDGALECFFGIFDATRMPLLAELGNAFLGSFDPTKMPLLTELRKGSFGRNVAC
jgi:hypothetical protein